MSDKKSDKRQTGQPSQDASPPPADAPDAEEPKPKKSLPMVSVPDDDQIMAEEMADLFDEDRVSHQHGSSEPEAD